MKKILMSCIALVGASYAASSAESHSSKALMAASAAALPASAGAGAAALPAPVRSVAQDMQDILSARIGKRFVYLRAPKNMPDQNIRKGEESTQSLKGFAKTDGQYQLMELADPLVVSGMLNANNVVTLPVQVTFHSVALEMLALLRGMPENCFVEIPSPRTETYFVVADAHGTQKKFISERLNDPKTLEVSVFAPGNTLILSSARYQQLRLQLPSASGRMKQIELTEISQIALTNSVSVRYNCSKVGEQLVKSAAVSGLLHTTDVCDCLCFCVRSISQKTGIMAHVNHAALGNITVFQELTNALRTLGQDLEITIVSSYLSAPIEKIMRTLNVISQNVIVQCFPIVFERNTQGVRNIVDSQRLTYDHILDIFGETSGGLTVLFDTQTGEIRTAITRITPAEKRRRVF